LLNRRFKVSDMVLKVWRSIFLSEAKSHAAECHDSINTHDTFKHTAGIELADATFHIGHMSYHSYFSVKVVHLFLDVISCER
jgi:hypothetical protein